MSSPIPSNSKLYNKVKEEAKLRFDRYPSAYASSWIVKTYKSRGGTYNSSRNKSKRESGLQRWYSEIWIDVCKLPAIVPCGRKSPKNEKQYPYCRPYKKITSKTPKTIFELDSKTLKRRCSIKQKIRKQTMK